MVIRNQQGKPIGRWLKAGGLYMLSVIGRCEKCGAEFYWAAAQQRLKELLEAVGK